MTLRTYRGDAPLVAQINHVTPTGPQIGTVYTITFSDVAAKSVSFTCTAPTVANAVAGLVAAWNVSTDGEFYEITASDGGGYVILTAKTEGMAFGPLAVAATGANSAGADEIQQWALGGVSAGTYTLAFDDGSTVATTSAINWNATSAQVVSAMEALSNVGASDVTCAVTSGTYTLTFRNALGNANHAAMTLTSALTGIASITAVAVTEGSSGLNQKRMIVLPTNTAGGTWGIYCWGPTTSATAANIAWNAAAYELEAALQSLAVIGLNNVTVTGSGPWTVEFCGGLARTMNPSLMYVNNYYLYRTDRIAVAEAAIGGAGVNEVQTIIYNEGTGFAGGTYTLAFTGYTTTALAYNANTATIQSYLEALTSIGANNVQVTTLFPGVSHKYKITFVGSLAETNVALVTADTASALCSATGLQINATITQSASAGVSETQLLTINTTAATAGTWTATFIAYTTAALNFNISAADCQAALQGLTSIGAGGITVTGTSLTNGGFTLSYGGSLANSNVALLTAATTIVVPLTTITVSAISEGSSATSIGVHTDTTNSGPNDASVAANWSGNAVPIDGDDVALQDCDVNILYGLSQGAIALASFKLYSSFTGLIGLPRMNKDDSAHPYLEYRTRYLTIDCGTFEVGVGSGDGTTRFNLDVGTITDTTVNVTNLGNSGDAAVPAMLLKGGSANGVLNLTRGAIGLNLYSGEKSNFPTVRVGNQGNILGDAMLRIGSGVTLTTIKQFGGRIETYSGGWTTWDLVNGEAFQYSGTAGTLDIREGTFVYNTNGTATAITIWPGGTLDLSQDMRPMTITSLTRHQGGTLTDPAKRGIYGALHTKGAIDDGLNVGEDRSLTFSA